MPEHAPPHLLGIQQDSTGLYRTLQDFTCFPEQGLLLPDLSSPTGPLLMPAAAPHVLPAQLLGSCAIHPIGDTQAAGGNAQWPIQPPS